VIEETDTSGNEIRSYFFFGGRRVAWRDSSGNVYYYFADAIGSTRAVTNATGTKCFDADYYPYGQENDYDTSCSPTYKFTGYEYDSETGNDYAYARYYNPRLGRFMSPDPLAGAVGNPQSLDRYTYVLNNPETFTDPLGLQCQQPSAGVVSCATTRTSTNEPDCFMPVMGGTGSIEQVPCQLAYWMGGRDTYYGGFPGSMGPGWFGPGIPGGGGGTGGFGSGNTASTPQTLTPQCTALQQQASQLALTLNQMSHASGFGAGVLGVLGLGSGVGEFFSLGTDTPLTVALFSGAGGFELISKVTGAAAGSLNSFAEGNPAPLEQFSFNQIEDFGLKLVASGVSPAVEFGAKLAETAQQAQDFANAVRGACQQ
jgi:RHS repeat-associated protein